MGKYPLEVKRRSMDKMFPWTSCLPFVENTRGVLIHRPRSVSTYTQFKTPYLAVGMWCGNGHNGEKNFTFLSAPPLGAILCERCEQLAVAAGLPSADELAGRHVHKGGVKAFRNCCIALPEFKHQSK
jgi:hypothetical protein